MPKKPVKKVSIWRSLISDCVKEMIAQAEAGGFTAKMELNGVTVLVNGDSNADLIYRDQQRAQSGYIQGEVGPYPKAELTAEEQANDQRIHAENEARWEKERQERQKIHEQQKKEFFAELETCPPMDRDEEKWQQGVAAQGDEGYGLACYTYAEYWARLMQKGIAEGKTLADIADECSHKADIEGITGFMYGCAVSILAACWKHGEELRKWHNLKTQIGDEGEKANESGGVLNPAMLCIGG